ncbi:S8 family serine peptidase [Methylosarcina fibrata]|uniref:S8 family serine peptidase n=1 Tax=Methylosarcina fibrata TaxID=105972 RepID=UPI00037699FD|nr:hypothetical protein [Methylosarcina fibrata]
MKENPVNPYLAHQEIALLLPWYVNKTLHDHELKAVEKHIKVCLTCRREMAILQKISLAVNQADALDSAAQASFSRLKSRLHQPEASASTQACARPSGTKQSTQPKWYHKLSLDFFRWPQTAAVMLSVLALAVIVPAYYLVGPLQQSDFRTLSSSETTSFNANEIKVIFAQGFGRQQIGQILDGIHGRIADGPSAEGVYLIRLTAATEAGAVLDALAALRKNSGVLFAEPAYALLSSSKPGGGNSE